MEKTAKNSAASRSKTAPRCKKARRITPDYLHNAALYYLGRYAASTERLRRVLTDKISKSCRDHPDQDTEALLPLIECEIETLTRVGLLNDLNLAELLIGNARNRGVSARAIRQKMALKGFNRETVDSLLRTAPDEQRNIERAAATRYLQRRKLWPYLKSSPADKNLFMKEKRKSWAALARQGYGPDIISSVCTDNLHAPISEDDWPGK